MSVPPSPTTTSSKKVIIIGAGIGGLTLAALLERANIDYIVFEKAKTVKPLGSAMVCTPTVMLILEQLGIADYIKANSKRIVEGRQFSDDLKPIGPVTDYRSSVDRFGHHIHILPRSVLYHAIATLVPSHKIIMGAKMLSFIQNNEGVMVRLWDNSSYHGEILVGADGAYSAVRQTLYKSILEKKGDLPGSDLVQLPFTDTCLVGTTIPLNPENFPFVALDDSISYYVISKTQAFSWLFFTVPENRICWMVLEHLGGNSKKDNDNFRNSEWGPEAAGEMCERVRDFQFPGGFSMGDLIDSTPRDYISKVMLEEKVFETWYSGRTVLIGDACHKLHPAGGSGAISAIHDATILANWLYELKSTSIPDLESAFKAYRDERYPIVHKLYEASRRLSKTLGQSWVSVLTRKVMELMPAWIWKRILDTMYAYRPQATFLPLCPHSGTTPPSYQASLHLARRPSQTPSSSLSTYSVSSTGTDRASSVNVIPI